MTRILIIGAIAGAVAGAIALLPVAASAQNGHSASSRTTPESPTRARGIQIRIRSRAAEPRRLQT